jgi:hypothetical protein
MLALDAYHLARVQFAFTVGFHIVLTVLHGPAGGRSVPNLIFRHTRRTCFGRPSSSMRFSTAMATSVARRRSVCERSASPVTRLKRLMSASTRATPNRKLGTGDQYG